MKRLLALLGIATLAGAAVVLPVAPSGAGLGTGASVYAVHGIADTPVDVCVEGTVVIPGFQPGTTAGPLTLAPGTYNVALTEPDQSSPCEEGIIYDEDLTIGAGSSTIVAWNAASDGVEPDLTVFANDVSCTEPGTGRVTARHAAGAAGAVNVVTGETVLVPGLEPGEQAALDVPVGTYPVEVQLASDDTVVLGPADITAVEGKNVIVHVVNALEEGGQPASAIPLVLDVGVCAAPAAPVVPAQPAFTG